MSNRGALLEGLFDLFTEQLLDEVKAAREEGNPLQAADKAAIIRFLQINNMAYVQWNSDAIDALELLEVGDFFSLDQHKPSGQTQPHKTLRYLQ